VNGWITAPSTEKLRIERPGVALIGEGRDVNGWITAPSILPGQKYGFVFIDCRLEGEMAPGSVY